MKIKKTYIMTVEELKKKFGITEEVEEIRIGDNCEIIIDTIDDEIDKIETPKPKEKIPTIKAGTTPKKEKPKKEGKNARWTDEDKQFIKDKWEENTPKEIADELGRSESVVRYYASKMGISKRAKSNLKVKKDTDYMEKKKPKEEPKKKVNCVYCFDNEATGEDDMCDECRGNLKQ